MTTRTVYDPTVALGQVQRTAGRLLPFRVESLRRRYVKATGSRWSAAALARAERRAWRKAHRSGRLNTSTVAALRRLASVSAAARNAGLAVLLRDRIGPPLFWRLTWLWRSHGLRLPAGPKRSTKPDQHKHSKRSTR